MRIIRRLFLVTGIIMLTMYGCQTFSSSRRDDSLAPAVAALRMEAAVTRLSRDIGPRNYAYYDKLQEAAEYIKSEFTQLGYDLEIQSYAIGTRQYENIIATRSGVTCALRPIVVGAHYDSCFNPGADDNASGIAGLIELARQLRNESSIGQFAFVAFVNEEPPYFMTEEMGSLVYTTSLKEQGKKIKGAVVLEMIGYYSDAPNSQRYFPLLGPFYPNKGNYIALVSNIPSRHLLKRLKTGFESSSIFPVESITAPGFLPGLNYSDHWSFWKQGFPAVMVTDTAFLRNPNYHKNSDLPETLDYAKMAEMLIGLKESLLKFAAY